MKNKLKAMATIFSVVFLLVFFTNNVSAQRGRRWGGGERFERHERFERRGWGVYNYPRRYYAPPIITVQAPMPRYACRPRFYRRMHHRPLLGVNIW